MIVIGLLAMMLIYTILGGLSQIHGPYILVSMSDFLRHMLIKQFAAAIDRSIDRRAGTRATAGVFHRGISAGRGVRRYEM